MVCRIFGTREMVNARSFQKLAVVFKNKKFPAKIVMPFLSFCSFSMEEKGPPTTFFATLIQKNSMKFLYLPHASSFSITQPFETPHSSVFSPTQEIFRWAALILRCSQLVNSSIPKSANPSPVVRFSTKFCDRNKFEELEINFDSLSRSLRRNWEIFSDLKWKLTGSDFDQRTAMIVLLMQLEI